MSAPSGAASGRLRASPPPPKGLAPLQLGSAQKVALIAYQHEGHAFIRIPDRGDGLAAVSVQGAAALSDWLYLFAQPKAELELWGIDGIASKCKVSRSTAYNWVGKEGFPAPVPVVGGNGQVWESRAVRAWVRLQRRKGGRPRKRETGR